MTLKSDKTYRAESPQYSLRTLMLLVAVCSVVLAVVAVSICCSDSSPNAADAPIKPHVRTYANFEQPADWKQVAIEHLLNGDREAAIAVYDRVLTVEPQDVKALVARGSALIRSGRDRFDEGVADIDRALFIAPKDPHALGATAEVLTLQRDYEKALQTLNRAIDLCPSSGVAFSNRGAFYLQRGHLKKALADLTKAVALAPHDFHIYETRGSIRLAIGEFEQAISDFNESLDLRPDSSHSLDSRGTAWMKLGEIELALEDYDEFVRLFPRASRAYVARARAHVHNGDYERGSKDLLMAIRLTPDDAGKNYLPTTGKELSKEALRHGEDQVKAMLQDRPEMARHVAAGDPLWTWTSRKFSGEDVGEPIFWDPIEPRFPAQHHQPYNGIPGRILINTTSLHFRHNGKLAQFEELWRRAVFELHNIALGERFQHVHNELRTGKLTKHEYVTAMIQVEHRAAQRTRAFYANMFLPWAIEKGFRESDPSFWFPDAGMAGWEEQWQPGDKYWDHYATGYDLNLARRAYEADDFEAARRKLESLLSQDPVPHGESLARAHYLLAMCQMRQGDTNNAQESFDRALQIDPNSVFALVGRAYLNLSPPDQALDDLDRAIEIAPDYADAYRHRASARNLMGDLKGALLDYDRLLQLEPRNVEAYINRGHFRLSQQQADLALQDLNEALRLNPDHATAYTQRGYAWTLKEDFDKALADFNEALRRDPNNSYALRWVSYLRSLHDREKASADIDAAITAAPFYNAAVLTRARSHEAMGDYQKAFTTYDQAIRISPQLHQGYYLRARLLLTCPDAERRDVQRAIQDAARACELTLWELPDYLSLLAEAHAQDGDFEAAIQWQSKAFEIVSDDAKAAYERKLASYRERRMQNLPVPPM